MDFLLKQCNQEDRVTPQNTETQNTQQQKIQKLNWKNTFFQPHERWKYLPQTDPHY